MQSYLFNTEVINAAYAKSLRDEGISIGRQEERNDLLTQLIANGEITATQAAKYQRA